MTGLNSRRIKKEEYIDVKSKKTKDYHEVNVKLGESGKISQNTSSKTSSRSANNISNNNTTLRAKRSTPKLSADVKVDEKDSLDGEKLEPSMKLSTKLDSFFEDRTFRCHCGQDMAWNPNDSYSNDDPKRFIQCESCQIWRHRNCIDSHKILASYLCEVCNPELHFTRTSRLRHKSDSSAITVKDEHHEPKPVRRQPASNHTKFTHKSTSSTTSSSSSSAVITPLDKASPKSPTCKTAPSIDTCVLDAIMDLTSSAPVHPPTPSRRRTMNSQVASQDFCAELFAANELLMNIDPSDILIRRRKKRKAGSPDHDDDASVKEEHEEDHQIVKSDVLLESPDMFKRQPKFSKKQKQNGSTSASNKKKEFEACLPTPPCPSPTTMDDQITCDASQDALPLISELSQSSMPLKANKKHSDKSKDFTVSNCTSKGIINKPEPSNEPFTMGEMRRRVRLMLTWCNNTKNEGLKGYENVQVRCVFASKELNSKDPSQHHHHLHDGVEKVAHLNQDMKCEAEGKTCEEVINSLEAELQNWWSTFGPQESDNAHDSGQEMDEEKMEGEESKDFTMEDHYPARDNLNLLLDKAMARPPEICFNDNNHSRDCSLLTNSDSEPSVDMTTRNS